MTEPLASRRIGPSSENTRSAILDMIRSGEVVSRIQLAEMSGLTGASITRIVKSLIADGLVLETGYGDSTGGKRPTLLELNRHARYAVGLSLDDTRLTYVVTDLAGATVGRLVSHGIERTPPHDVIDRVVLELERPPRRTRDRSIGCGRHRCRRSRPRHPQPGRTRILQRRGVGGVPGAREPRGRDRNARRA